MVMHYFLIMESTTVTRHSQVTIPKAIRDAMEISEGDNVKMTIVEEEGGRGEGKKKKIVVEKIDADVWSDCSDFLPEDFGKLLSSIRADSRSRFKRLGIIP